MGNVSRFSVSIEKELLGEFTRFARRRGLGNRSEALRDLMREAIVREEWRADAEIVGTITIVYDHGRHDLSHRLTHSQHDFHDAILATMHVHLDRDNCLEVIAVRGRASRVQRIADILIGTRGVKHGKLCATTTGRRLI